MDKRGESVSKEMENFLDGGRGWRTILPAQLRGARADLGFTRPLPHSLHYHSTEDALPRNVLLRPSGSLASGLLSPQPAWSLVRWEIGKHTHAKQSFERFLQSSLFRPG